jgi:hypothetical protein
MAKKYNNLKNLTPEEFKEYKNKQKRVIRKRYYDNHKEEISRRRKSKYNYSKTYKERIDKAINYIEYEMPCLWEVDEVFEDMNGRYYNTWKEYDENKLLDILKGEKL